LTHRIRRPGFLLLIAVAVLFDGCVALRAPSPPPAEAPPAEAPPAPRAVTPLPMPALPSAPPPTSPLRPAPPAPTRPPPIPPRTVSPADKAFVDGMADYDEGRYERALERFTAAWKERPGHPLVSRAFDDALLELKKSGDLAQTQGKSEDAGKRWMATIRFLGSAPAKDRSYPFSRADVRAQVDRLTAGLTEKALLSYRKGDIPGAIATWKTILAYEPENEEAARSIRTASKQLENLKKIPPAK
jgi:hypothetical protein